MTLLRSLVGTRVQVSFTPRQGCFSPFPLGTLLYRSSDIFSLGPWAARIQPEFHVLRPTQESFSGRRNAFAYGALTLSGWLSQYHSTDLAFGNCPSGLQTAPKQPYYPDIRNACRLARIRFRLLPFRSPLLRVSLRFLLCPATEMFHFADFAPAVRGSPAFAGGVAPFGYPRVYGRLHLSGAFRSLPRPSSLSDALASSVCPSPFPLHYCFAFYSVVKLHRVITDKPKRESSGIRLRVFRFVLTGSILKTCVHRGQTPRTPSP